MKKYRPGKYLCYLYLLLPLIFYFVIPIRRENDIWFLLSHGRYVLTNGIPHYEILSMHNNFSFVMQQWLSSVIFYAIHNYLGSLSFYIFMFLITCVYIYIIYKICIEITNGNVFASSLVTSILVLFLELYLITPRPQIFSTLIFLILILIMEKYNNKNKKAIYYIPLLSILLINLHASMWPCLFIFMMPYIAEYLYEYIKNKDEKIKRIIPVILVSITCGFINPYGLKAMTYAVGSYGNQYINRTVGEMSPFLLVSKYLNMNNSFQIKNSYFIFIVFLTLLFIMLQSKKSKPVHHILMIYGTFFMAAYSLRSINLFLALSVPYISYYISIKNKNDKVIPYKTYVILLSIALSIFIYNICTKNYKLKNIYNEKIVEYLKENANTNITLYTNYDDGAYYEYHGYKPYIDPRAEVFLKVNNKQEDIFKEYYDLMCGKMPYEYFVSKYDFDYYVVDQKEGLASYLLDNNNYELVFKNSKKYLIKRKE